MRVLVVCKTTNLDLHGENIRKRIATGSLPRQHLEHLERAHASHYATRDKLLQSLCERAVEFVEVGRGRFWPNLKGFDAVITIGGDGTILEASHHIHNNQLILIGLRSSPTSIGHLCIGGGEIIESMLTELLNNSLKSVELSRLQAKIQYMQTKGVIVTDPVLNDFLYTNVNPAATTRYRIMLDNQKEEHKSSGVWIATAAGSTAAIAAAGGEQVPMNANKFQYLVRELYTPPNFPPFQIKSGFFDPDKEVLSIENRCDQAILALDGQHGSMTLEFGDVVTFMRGPSLRLAYSR